MNNKPIIKGSIVKYNGGWYRVTAVFYSSPSVNLGPIFGGRLSHRAVPLAQVFEDEAAWFERWTQSETYMSM